MRALHRVGDMLLKYFEITLPSLESLWSSQSISTRYMRYILWAHFVRFMDTRLIRTPQYYGEFVLSLRKEIRPLHFSKFSNLSMLPSVSVLIGFNCAVKPTLRTTENTDSSLLRTVCFVHRDREFLHFL